MAGRLVARGQCAGQESGPQVYGEGGKPYDEYTEYYTVGRVVRPHGPVVISAVTVHPIQFPLWDRVLGIGMQDIRIDGF